MNKHFIILVLFIFLGDNLSAQLANKKVLDKYWIQFTDKKNTPFSVFIPEKYLSARAIERRQKQGIFVDESDLPVDPEYINTLKTKGVVIYNISKWLNAAVVRAEPSEIEEIKKLPFVKKVEQVGFYHQPKTPKEPTKERIIAYPKISNPYGDAALQIEMLNGHLLHQMGYDGKGMYLAVFDGGFMNVNTMPFFDKAFKEGRFLDTWDFVDNDAYLYESSSHGTQALSTIAADLPGLMVGTSPKAYFHLYRTEDVESELRIEEDNWVAAAERADSAGVDVINSSLGYTKFDYDKMNYSYESLDGHTARVSQAANFAASKGMIPVNSAGNSGFDSWKYVGTPADAEGTFAVGAVDSEQQKSYFSSFGPTYDGRTKPNVAALGTSTTVAALRGYKTTTADGTSFSSPVMAGMVTSLWQAFPNAKAENIRRAIEQNSSFAQKPNNKLGYGIPDFYKAYQSLSENAVNISTRQRIFMKAPIDSNIILHYIKDEHPVVLGLYDILGRELKTETIENKNLGFSQKNINLDDLPSGNYHIIVRTATQEHFIYFFKRTNANKV